jgi:hypothetical protein
MCLSEKQKLGQNLMFRASTQELVQFLGEHLSHSFLTHPQQPKHFKLLSADSCQLSESSEILKKECKSGNVTKFEQGSVVEHAHHATLAGHRSVIVHVASQSNSVGSLWWAKDQDNDDETTTTDEKELFNCTNIFLSCFPSQFQPKSNDDAQNNDNDSVWMIGNVALLREQEKKQIFEIKKIRKCAVCIIPRPRAKSVESWKSLFEFLTNKSQVGGSRIIFPLDLVITQPDSMVRDLFTAALEFPITFTYPKTFLPRIYLLLTPKKSTKITPTFSSNSTSSSESLF